MLYNEERKNAILDDLQNKLVSLAYNAVKFSELGFHQPKNLMLLQIDYILYNAFESIDVFSEKQHNEFENLYNSLRKYE